MLLILFLIILKYSRVFPINKYTGLVILYENTILLLYLFILSHIKPT